MLRIDIAFISSLFLVSSCTFHEDKDISTFKVSYTDFNNTLMVDGFVEPVRSSTASCPPYIEGIVAYLVEDGTYVNEGDTVCVVEVQEMQNSYDQLLISLENANAGLNKTKADLNMQFALLEAQVRNNEAEVEIAQLDSLQLKYSPPNQRKIKELELEKVAIQKAGFEKKLKSLAVIQQSEIRRLELEIERFSNRVQKVKAQLDALKIRAPKSGLAIRAIYPLTNKKLQVGDPVWHNMPLVNLPELSEMKVKIFTSEMDYKYINVNDSVSYTFDAMPDNVAWGKVIMKSPVGKQYKEGSKVKFFEIEASMDSSLTLPEPGLTVNCNVTLKQLKDTLVIPQVAIFEEDSIKVVFVKRNDGYEMRQIMTGLSSPKEVVITSGLKNEEIISLTRPSQALIKEKVLLPDSIKKASK